MKALLQVLISIIIAVSAVVRYDGHQVLRLTLQPDQLEEARRLNSLSLTSRLDWWVDVADWSSVASTADVRVSPSDLTKVEAYLKSQGIQYSVMIQDVQAMAEEQMLGSPGDDWFKSYHDYNSTVVWIKNLVTQYPNLATLVTIGTTFQGRTIYGVQVTGAPNGTAPKPQIFYDGGIHAREWISPATVSFILNQLLSLYGKDAEVTHLVDAIQWTIVPIFNADGYQYTWTGDRMWRKTRMPNKGSSCMGTDPCRNSATGWGGAGSSSDPCDDTYRGTKPFDQPEVNAVAQYIKNLGNVKAYTNFHSYSQLFMSPWGYTYDLPPQKDYVPQIALGKKVVAAIKAAHGQTYVSGPVAPTIYQASGVISDWVYAQVGVVYSYACELRDTGQHGFLLPAIQIIPTGEEIFSAAKVMAHAVLGE
jgi:murein tripeptide amidase MpaA